MKITQVLLLRCELESSTNKGVCVCACVCVVPVYVYPWSGGNVCWGGGLSGGRLILSYINKV